MNTAEQNYRLLQEIDANRRFMLMVYQQNPKLLEQAEARIRQWFEGQAHRQIEERTGFSAILDPQSSILNPQKGASLIELIMFIVIVSAALAGILLVMNVTTKGSADPLIHKQALAIAESLLEEVELMPFTYCDPDDPNAATATSTAGCTVMVESMGPEAVFTPYQAAVETRYGPSSFDNVNDYAGVTAGAAGFTMNAGNGGIKDISGVAITALSGYSATVTMTQPGLGGIAGAETLLINVTVTGPDGVGVTLEGYRTRFAPNGLP